MIFSWFMWPTPSQLSGAVPTPMQYRAEHWQLQSDIDYANDMLDCIISIYIELEGNK